MSIRPKRAVALRRTGPSATQRFASPLEELGDAPTTPAQVSPSHADCAVGNLRPLPGPTDVISYDLPRFKDVCPPPPYDEVVALPAAPSCALEPILQDHTGPPPRGRKGTALIDPVEKCTTPMRTWLTQLPEALLSGSMSVLTGAPFPSGAHLLAECDWLLSDPAVRRFVVAQRMSDSEALAVAVFTAQCPHIFGAANRYLRTGNTAALAKYAPFVSWLLQGLQRCPQRTGVVFRAWDSKLITTEYVRGRPLHWQQFSSTAAVLTPAQLETFGRHGATGTAGVLLAIDASTGCVLGPLSFFPDEGEVVLPPPWKGGVRGTAAGLESLVPLLGVDLTPYTVLEVVEIDDTRDKDQLTTSSPTDDVRVGATPLLNVRELLKDAARCSLLVADLLPQLRQDLAACALPLPSPSERAMWRLPLYPDHAKDPRWRLATVLCHVGFVNETSFHDKAKAFRFYEEAYRVDPSSDIALLGISRCLQTRGLSEQLTRGAAGAADGENAGAAMHEVEHLFTEYIATFPETTSIRNALLLHLQMQSPVDKARIQAEYEVLLAKDPANTAIRVGYAAFQVRHCGAPFSLMMEVMTSPLPPPVEELSAAAAAAVPPSPTAPPLAAAGAVVDATSGALFAAAETQMRLAMAARHKKQYELADAHYQAAYNIDPRMRRLSDYGVFLLTELKDYRRAFAVLNEEVKLNPSMELCRAHLGELLWKHHDALQADDDRAGLAAAGINLDAANLALVKRYWLDAARRHFEAAVSLDERGRPVDALTKLGWLLHETGDIIAADNAFDKLNALIPNHPACVKYRQLRSK